MKTRIQILYILSLFSLVLFSCEKDEDRVTLQPGAPSALTATSSTLVLDKADASKDAVTISWTPTNFGFDAAVKYTLQIDKKGNNFAAPKTVDLANGLQKKYTVSELNSLLGQLEIVPGNAGQIEMRVKSEIVPAVPPVYSSALTITATPYLDIIDYPSIYMPGDYQGWAPSKAPKISSVKDDKIYEGYIYFPGAETKFKFTSNPDWDHTNYGYADGGKLSTAGGDLYVGGEGYYLVKADLNALTWSATKTSWGIVGDATGSWENDKDMTYDATSQVWKVTVDLEGDKKIKFRANRDPNWTINLGDVEPATGLLKYGGKDIPIKESGKYEVTLNLSIPGNYSYTLKKI